MNNKFPTPPLFIFFSFFFLRGAEIVSHLTLHHPPSFLLSLTQPLHLLLERELGCFLCLSCASSSLSLQAYALLLSAACLYFPRVFPQISFLYISISCSLSLFYPGTGKRSSSREHCGRRLTTITGKGSGQWPVWDRGRSRGAVVKQLWTNGLRFLVGKTHIRGERRKRSNWGWEPVGFAPEGTNLDNPKRGSSSDKDQFGGRGAPHLELLFVFWLYEKKNLKFLHYNYIPTNTLEFLCFLIFTHRFVLEVHL